MGVPEDETAPKKGGIARKTVEEGRPGLAWCAPEVCSAAAGAGFKERRGTACVRGPSRDTHSSSGLGGPHIFMGAWGPRGRWGAPQPLGP